MGVAAALLAGCSAAPSDTSAQSADGVEVSALTASPAPGTTMFGGTSPTVAAAADTQSVELGTRFTVSQSGSVTAIRFFKKRATTGTFTGALWSANGTKLASVNFTSTTSSGWQQANLTTPVLVSPGQSYVVSYHAPNGRYAATNGGFTTAKSTGGAITGPADSDGGSNGVYAYGSGQVFPAKSYRSTNYWVDAVFQAGVGAVPPSNGPSASPTTTVAPTTSTTTTTTTTVPPTTTTVKPPTTGTWPNAANTGVPAGTVLRPSGDITVTQNGAVLDGLDITGCVNVMANDVTIRRSRITGSSCYQVVNNYGMRLLVEDVEIIGVGSPTWAPTDCISYNNYTARRVNIHGCQIGAKFGDNTVMEYSYIHDLTLTCPADVVGYDGGARCSHNDGMQTMGGSNVVIRYNNIDNNLRYGVSAVKIGCENSAKAPTDPNYEMTSNVSVYGNRLNGGGFTVYGGGAEHPGEVDGTNISVTNNTFGNAAGVNHWGVLIYATPGLVWSGNIMEGTGAPA